MSGIINSAGSKSGVIGTTELDYEEGTWTPVFFRTSSNWSIRSSDQAGVYTKIGRFVFLRFQLYIDGITTQGTRMLTISGLPFTASATGNYGGGGNLGNQGAITGGTGCDSLSAAGTTVFCHGTNNPTVNEGLIGETGAATITVQVGWVKGALAYSTTEGE